MSKTFRAWDVDQAWLLPPSVHDFVPAGHPAHLVRELVRAELDLAAIVADYEREERGQPPYHPAMMVALLLYAYTRGVYASRRIAKACEERLDVMAVTRLQQPGFPTLNDLREGPLQPAQGDVLWPDAADRDRACGRGGGLVGPGRGRRCCRRRRARPRQARR